MKNGEKWIIHFQMIKLCCEVFRSTTASDNVVSMSGRHMKDISEINTLTFNTDFSAHASFDPNAQISNNNVCLSKLMRRFLAT